MSRIEEIKRFSELRNKFASNQLDTHGKIEFENLCEKLDPIDIVGTLLDQLEKCHEALEFTLNAAENLYQPDRPVHKGLDPTFYHALTYEGDLELIEKTNKARATLRDVFGKGE